eukprot:1145566-Pelagomonas_calceolata.AAC.5
MKHFQQYAVLSSSRDCAGSRQRHCAFSGLLSFTASLPINQSSNAHSLYARFLHLFAQISCPCSRYSYTTLTFPFLQAKVWLGYMHLFPPANLVAGALSDSAQLPLWADIAM